MLASNAATFSSHDLKKKVKICSTG